MGGIACITLGTRAPTVELSVALGDRLGLITYCWMSENLSTLSDN